MRNSRLVSRWRRRLFAGAVVAAQAVGAPCALAQSAPQAVATPAKVAEAEVLFKRAATHMDAREYEAACPLLEQSNALDPSSGTLLNLAECYEQRGLTASAYGTFEAARDIATRTGRADRAEVAELRKRKLEPLLRRLTIVPPNPAPQSLVILLDGKLVDRARWNVPLLVDPGEHVVRASADAVPDFETRVLAPQVGTNRALPIPISAPRPVERDRSSALDGQRVGAFACGILGVAGVATGTIFGLKSQSKHEESDQHCTGQTCRDSEGVKLMEDARRAGTVSTVGFIVGGVGLGAAAVLWFARPFGPETAGVEVGLGPGAVRVAGRW